MLSLAGYDILTVLHQSARTLIYRARQHQPSRPVILKTIVDGQSAESIAQFHHEYQILRSLAIDGVIQVHSLDWYRHLPVLVLEDVGGLSLNEYIQQHPLTIGEFLTIAVQLAETIGKLHQHQIIHRDIKPSNIIISPETQSIKLIDFAIALRQQSGQRYDPLDRLEGTLAYMSPEQTGRMNRTVDYRTDFYSLGVTLYELLCHQLPFDATEPLELVHCHIARQPIPPHQVDSSIPLVLSNIVMKLLAKMADDRYQNAWGIEADLVLCLMQYEATGAIDNIRPGDNDISDRFQIPQKLYGREACLQELVSLFNQVAGDNLTNLPASLGSQSQPRLPILALVSGYAGCGKTSLVNELYRTVAKRHGHFVRGDFTEAAGTYPYSAILTALRSLFNQLLGESESRLNYWRSRLQAVVTGNRTAILEWLPEVQLVMGESFQMPTTCSIAFDEASLVIQRILHVFCAPEHPMVIFLDNMQWADPYTLRLLEESATNPNLSSLLLIGAYRSNEIDNGHPLLTILVNLHGTGIICHIPLEPLPLEAMTKLLADTFRQDRSAVHPLAVMVMRKTAGNPRFVHECLALLHHQSLIWFDFERLAWAWDLNAIAAIQITDNLVELAINKLSSLPEPTRQVIQVAACLGQWFDLASLAMIQQCTVIDLYSNLSPAVEEGLVVSASEQDFNPQYPTVNTLYRFLHKRVQQAAYGLIPLPDRAAMHLQVGRLLLHNTSPSALEDNLFDILNHLNLGADLITDTKERTDLVRLNLLTGKKAISIKAHTIAATYFNAGLKLLPADSWQTHHEQTLSLHSQGAIANFLASQLTMAMDLASVIFQQTNCLLEQITACEVTLRCLAAQSQIKGAVTLALGLIQQLHGPLVDRDAMGISREPSLDRLEHLPPMTHPESLAVMRLLGHTVWLAQMVDPTLHRQVVDTMLELSLQRGYTVQSALGYACYGSLLCSEGNRQLGIAYGHLAQHLAQQLRTQDSEAEDVALLTDVVIASAIAPWSQPIRQVCTLLHQVSRASLIQGCPEAIAISNTLHCQALFLSGEPLADLEPIYQQHRVTLSDLKQAVYLVWLDCWHQTIQKWTGHRSPSLGSESAHEVPNAISETTVKKHDARVLPLVFHTANAYLAYGFGDNAQAHYHATEAAQYVDSGVGSLVLLQQSLQALTALAIVPQASHPYPVDARSEQTPASDLDLTVIATIQGQCQYVLHPDADGQPAWIQGLHHLMAAELARVQAEPLLAMEHYDQGIQVAQTGEFRCYQAIIYERAAFFYAHLNRQEIAHLYRQRAYENYDRWGATAKVSQLSQCYPRLADNSSSLPPQPASLTATTSNASGSHLLDFATIFKASQVLASEIILDRFLEKLMQIAIENAGAEWGSLLLEHQGIWTIAASGDSTQVTVLTPASPTVSEPLEPLTLPESVLNYVFRTGSAVVLDHATQIGQFINDPYIRTTKPKSLLCSPLIHQNKLSGILYLENNLTTQAFTPDRLEVLKLLSSQIAISLENIQLYSELQQFNHDLERLVTERTQELLQTLENLRTTQSQLVESEKMAALGSLVAGIAHEVNTPIGIGVTAASLLADRTAMFLATYRNGAMKRSELETFLDMASQSSQMILANLGRAAELIQSFKQVAIDQSSEERRRFNLSHYLDEVLLSLRPKLKVTQHHITIHSPDDISLDSYPGAFSQIITNLLINSLVHAYHPDDQGHITITVQANAQQLTIRYTDDGKGISPDNLSKIFDPFFTTRRGQGGSGLGLHIVYNLVTQKLNGQITCQSSVGQGTTFLITLPLAQ